MIDARIFNKVDHRTNWGSRTFPVLKSGSNPLAVRWVADFKTLNMVLKRPVLETESSNQLMRHISPKTKYFCTADTITGYHPISVTIFLTIIKK